MAMAFGGTATFAVSHTSIGLRGHWVCDYTALDISIGAAVNAYIIARLLQA